MFFGLLNDSTPRYLGLGAASARSSGLLGILSGLLGGTGTPTYVGGGQPAQQNGIGLRLFGGNPTYKQPPAAPEALSAPTPEQQEPTATPAAADGVSGVEAKGTKVTISVRSRRKTVSAGELQQLQDRLLDE